MKKILKKFVVIIVLIMVLLSSFVPNVAFADENLPDYNGLPVGGEFGVITFTDWIINTLKDILNWFIGIMTYIIKAVFLGWANIIEKAITAIVGIGTATTQEGSLTIEKIVTNKVPILDINFFDFSNAGGRTLNSDSVIYVIRESVAQFYYIIRNITIAGMLITLIYIGIRIAISSIAEAKAKYKAMLQGWLESMVLVFFIHYIMVFIIAANNWFIKIISSTMGAEESLYDTIRSQSYAIQASIGWPATIIYIALIYLLIKFLFIYMKRFANVAILTFLAPVIAISYAIDKIKDGKSQSFSRWLKDYIINVFTQAVHCLLYFMFVSLAFNVAGQSIYGVVLAIFLISCISRGEKIFKTIFGMDTGKSGAAPIDGIEGKPWKDFVAKAAVFKGAAKWNNKWIGFVATPITKPLGAGLNRIRSATRNSRLSNIRQSLDLARATGTDSINVRTSIFGRGREMDVSQLLSTGKENGFSNNELAEMLNEQIESDKKEKATKRKEGLKNGLKNAAATLGMAASMATFTEDPILGAKMFVKYNSKRQKTIKGYKSSENYIGPADYRVQRNLLRTGIFTGAAVALANPVLGTVMIIKFARKRSQTIKGYKNNLQMAYTASPKNKKKMGRFRTAVKFIGRTTLDYTNISSVNMLFKQLKYNLSESNQKQIAQTLISQYKISNNMLEKRIEEEYNNLLKNQNVNKEELDKIMIEASRKVSIQEIEQALNKVDTNYTIKQKTDISNMEMFNNSFRSKDVTIDIERTENLRSRTNGNELVVKANDLTDVESFVIAVMDLKQNASSSGATTVLAEFGGVEFNADNFVKIDDFINAVIENDKVDKNKLVNVSTNKEEQSNMDLATVNQIIDDIANSNDEINVEGFKESFVNMIKEKIESETGIESSKITNQEINSTIAKMSSENVKDILAVAGTKNNSNMKSKTSGGLFKKILTLIEKTKYNDYAIGELSYNRNQAKEVTQKIKINRAKGVE